MHPTVTGVNKKKIMLGVILLTFAITMIALVTVGFLTLSRNTIYPIVYIEGINVSDLTQEEAKEKVKTIYEGQLIAFHINLAYEDYERQVAYSELGYTYMYDEAVKEAYTVGRKGNVIKRMQEIYHQKNNPYYIALRSYYDEALLEAIIKDIEEHINKEAKDATIKRENNAFHITKEEIGIEVNSKALANEIIGRIQTFSQDAIDIPIIYHVPRVTEEKLLNIEVILSEFSTTFNALQEGRSKNIAIASSSINNTLIMPGEEFSFNTQTGPRGASAGYQEAPVIINGELVPGIGGGICQVSTTLYNAVIGANLEVTSRRNHSLPVAYVPLGHDATVAYNHIDLKFVNNLEHPIYVESLVDHNKVFARIYGKRENRIKVALASEVIETIEYNTEIQKDANLFIGEKRVKQEGKNGYRVRSYKVYRENGVEIKRELVSTDRYAPLNKIIIEGTKPRPKSEGETGTPQKINPEKPVDLQNEPINGELEQDDEIPL